MTPIHTAAFQVQCGEQQAYAVLQVQTWYDTMSKTECRTDTQRNGNPPPRITALVAKEYYNRQQATHDLLRHRGSHGQYESPDLSIEVKRLVVVVPEHEIGRHVGQGRRIQVLMNQDDCVLPDKDAP